MYLNTANKEECFGCEGCSSVCVLAAIRMEEDNEGFRYPVINKDICINCGMCRNVCPATSMPIKHGDCKYTFGGYHLDEKIRYDSTSGGAFTAIVDSFCDENYVVFGAEADGLAVHHGYIEDKSELYRFRKSKYSQSIIGSCFKDAGKFLRDGSKVLFSGTPCQISALVNYLDAVHISMKNLLTVEVVCEGVPSPLYIRKLDKALEAKYGQRIDTIDYRFTGKGIISKGKWDF